MIIASVSTIHSDSMVLHLLQWHCQMELHYECYIIVPKRCIRFFFDLTLLVRSCSMRVSIARGPPRAARVATPLARRGRQQGA